MLYTREISENLISDVVVIGGGTAGVFAAVAAAITGAKVLLIEKNSILGGTMTVANVNFPGLFFAWGKQIIGGPCWESIKRAEKLGGAVIPDIPYKADPPNAFWREQILLNRFIYSSVLFDMCDEYGVEVLCNAMLADVVKKDDEVQFLINGKEGLFSVEAKTAIDATGDANLCNWQATRQ